MKDYLAGGVSTAPRKHGLDGIADLRNAQPWRQWLGKRRFYKEQSH